MDELVTVDTYWYSPWQIVLKAADEGQPPLDNLIGGVLARLGLAESDWWVRAPAAVFGAAGVLLLGVFVWRMTNGLVAAMAAALLAVCPLHVYMSQEVRPYTLFFFLALASLLLFLRARRVHSLAAWACFSITLLAGLMTRWVDPHFVTLGILLFAASAYWQAGPAERAAEQNRLRAAFTSVCFAYAVYGPFFGIVLDRSRGAVAAQPTGLAARVGEQLLNSYASLLAGYSGRTLFQALPADSLALLAVGPVCMVGVGVLIAKWVRQRDSACGLFVVAVLPFCFLYAATFAAVGNALPKPQYLLFGAALVFPAFAVGVGSLAGWLTHQHRFVSAAFSAAGCLGIGAWMAQGSVASLQRADKQDWRGLMGHLKTHADPEDTFAVIAADTVPPSFHVAAYGRGRYGPAFARFVPIRLESDPAILQSGEWTNRDNTVWIVAYTDRMYRGVDPLEPPVGTDSVEVHVLEGLMLIGIRGRDPAAQRFAEGLRALYRGLPDGRSLAAPAFFEGKCALAAGDVAAASTWFRLARRQCRTADEAVLLETQWIAPALASVAQPLRHASVE